MQIAGYKIKRCIGQGGMATAYLAEQSSLGRRVVLKILDTASNDTPQLAERFLNEGRLVASLQHPNIITIYDIGREDNKVFISMEYVDGGDLKTRLQQGPLEPRVALGILERVADGLAAAHASGIVHRDVKPGNILFRRDGTPLLSDFGIAKRLTGNNNLTTTGIFLGSPNYMAPEQADADPIDGRADIYALGIILFEMLTGRKPYQSTSVIDVIHQHKYDPIPRLPLPLIAFQPLLDRMLAKDRNDRFPDVTSLLEYLREIRQHEFGDVPPLAPLPRRARVRRRLLLLLVLVALGDATLLLIEHRTPARQPVPAASTSVAADLAAIGSEPPLATADGTPVPATQELSAALLWLGQHSLDELRLTAPPRDNALYYFTRLLRLEPENTAARQGLRRIAAAYALLAERAIAEDSYAKARGYVGIGLQIDPQNESLLALQKMTDPQQRGWFAALRRFFS